MENDKLNIVANVSQLYSLWLLLKDSSNNDLMKELQRQNKDYLSKIIKQNELIMEKLGIKDGDDL